jgi:hypothetical protein
MAKIAAGSGRYADGPIRLPGRGEPSKAEDNKGGCRLKPAGPVQSQKRAKFLLVLKPELVRIWSCLKAYICRSV